MERRGGEWGREMTAGRIRTRVPVGVQARIWSGLLFAPQCPHIGFSFCIYMAAQSSVSKHVERVRQGPPLNSSPGFLSNPDCRAESRALSFLLEPMTTDLLCFF